MIGTTSRVYVPPPEFSIIPHPSTVTIKPGDQVSVELELKSDTNVKSEAIFAYQQIL